MQDAGGGFSMAMIVVPVVILLVIMVGIALVRLVVKNYITVPPNEAAILSGKKSGTKSYKTYTGGAFFRIPVVQRVDYLSLNVMTFQVSVTDVPDKNGVLVSVRGIANVKIESEEQSIQKAVERFLGMKPEQIAGVAKENLEGNLRAIVGKMDIEGLINDRQAFQSAVMNEAGIDMGKLGMVVDLLNIQEITDGKGYIESLGRKRTAEVIRDATIGEAEAHRDSDIKSAAAGQIGEIAKAEAQEEISSAERQRDMVIAKNKAQVEAEQARIPLAAEAATAEGQKLVNVAQVAAAQARVEAEIELQEATRRRREAELNATEIVGAEKEKEARIIRAEGAKESAELDGEAYRVKAEKEGKGEEARMKAESEGRKATAQAEQAELEAQAAGHKAKLLAEADGKKALLLAEAEGTEARGLAEAKAAEAKAIAFTKLDDAGRFLMLLEASPPVINALGDALQKVIVPAAQAIGDGLSNVDEIRLIDLGGSGANGNGQGNVLSQFMKAPPEALFGLLEQLQATNMGPVISGLLAKAGIDVSSTLKAKKIIDAGEVPDEPTGETDTTIDETDPSLSDHVEKEEVELDN